MKAAIASDIHFNNFKPFATFDTAVKMNSRFAEIVNAFVWMANDAIERGCEALFIPGDMFHVRGSLKPSVFNVVARVLQDIAAKIPVVILPGNHDMENYKGGETAVDSLEMITGVYVFRQPSFLAIKGMRILGVPYIHDPKEFMETLTQYKDEEFDCVMLHQGVDNFKVPGMPELGVTAADLQAFTDKPVITGHYHLPRLEGNVLSPGSLVPHGFGDSEEAKGYWTWDFEKNETEFVEVPGPRFRTISKKADVKSLPNGCYVRVEAGTTNTANKLTEAVLEAGALGAVARINKKFKTAHEHSLNLAGPKDMLVEYLGLMDETKNDVGELMSLFEEIVEGGAE